MLKGGIQEWKRSSASHTQTSLTGLSTSNERRQWQKAKIQTLRSGAANLLVQDDVARRRKRRGSRGCLTDSTPLLYPWTSIWLLSTIELDSRRAYLYFGFFSCFFFNSWLIKWMISCIISWFHESWPRAQLHPWKFDLAEGWSGRSCSCKNSPFAFIRDNCMWRHNWLLWLPLLIHWVQWKQDDKMF